MFDYVVMAISLSVFVAETYLIYISLGFRKSKRAKCKGYLNTTTQYRNKYVGRKSGRFYKHYIDYIYTYTVDGKTYRISGGAPGIKNNLRQTVDVIYNKKHPRFSYADKVTFPLPIFAAVFLFPVSAFFLVSSIIIFIL